MTYYSKVSKKICEISEGFLILNFKLLHILSRRGIKHFKYNTYLTTNNKINCNNKNFLIIKINK